LGYAFLYNLPYFLAHPIEILAVWKGGMSFHGGLIGVIAAAWIFAKIRRLSFWMITDELAIVLPLGIFLGRLANYANGELYGFAGYSGPFAMMVSNVPHFPSPLLEAGLEGIVLGLALWAVTLSDRPNRPKPSRRAEAEPSSVNIDERLYRPKRRLYSGLFLLLYGTFRIIAERFRLPDAQIGYVFENVSLGAILSAPMVLFGILIVFLSLRKSGM
jgi:phosphatidylglycerol---prolipoprotein diacylglyceryl transferase